MHTNETRRWLIDLGLSTPDSIEPYYPRVRDRDDVGVLHCTRSGVILLDRTDHISDETYEGLDEFAYWDADNRARAARRDPDDIRRRTAQCRDLVAEQNWLEVGTGAGALLDALAPTTRQTIAVEPQPGPRRALAADGYTIYPSIADVPESFADVCTLMHVLEHIVDPVAFLQTLRTRLRPGARLIVEVPHARDILMGQYNCESFRAFTLWNEHLLLHTRESLRRLLDAAGFTHITIQGVQRYPLANHLHWLAKQAPGGHVKWSQLRTPELDAAYASMLATLDATDTLIAHTFTPAAQ